VEAFVQATPTLAPTFVKIRAAHTQPTNFIYLIHTKTNNRAKNPAHRIFIKFLVENTCVWTIACKLTKYLYLNLLKADLVRPNNAQMIHSITSTKAEFLLPKQIAPHTNTLSLMQTVVETVFLRALPWVLTIRFSIWANTTIKRTTSNSLNAFLIAQSTSSESRADAIISRF